MNNYGYLYCLLFFVFSGTNMSSNIIKLSIDEFLTQWAFHKLTAESEFGRRSYDLPKLEVICSQILNWPS